MSCVSLLLGVEGVPQELIDELHRSVMRKLHERRVHPVHIAAHHSSLKDFYDQADYEAIYEPHKRGVDSFEDRVLDQQQNCLAYAFGRYTLQDVVVVVYGPRSSDDDQTDRWEWVTARVASHVPVYQVHQSESDPGEFYMVGLGFGETINVATSEAV